MSEDEQKYKSMGFIKTKGTVYQEPPSVEDLVSAFRQQCNALSPLTVGARALAKHVVYPRLGSDEDKNILADTFLTNFISTATWKNIHRINAQHIIYEIRDDSGFGFRWYVDDPLNIVFRGAIEPYATYLDFKARLT